MKRILVAGAAACACLSLGFVLQADDDAYLKITRGLDIFGKVYREVVYDYVEKIDPEKFVKYGIGQMLSSLDPYTVFIDDDQSEEIDLLTNGKYGGIGISVGRRDGAYIVTNVMAGYTAAQHGVKNGDVIVQIDSVPLSGLNAEEVRDLFRGEPGTQLRLRLRRTGQPAPIDLTLTREEIVLKNITYSAVLPGGVGYIRLEHFTRGAGEEVRNAAAACLAGGAKKIVLDLRNNPGGLLDQAVEVVSQFVPQGSLVVSTRGRDTDSEHKYYSPESPVAPDAPMAVLVNGESASASEIVAGALQDMDRAVIIGTRTFGKGLVQTITPLPYNTTLKITTAKYYTPSGRCIQEIDYANKRGGFFQPYPDSARKTFYTLHHRPVRNDGGITPDSIVRMPQPPQLVETLADNDYFGRFFDANDSLATDSALAAKPLYDAFVSYLQSIRFSGDPDLHDALDSAIADAREDRYDTSLIERLRSAQQYAARQWRTIIPADEKTVETDLLIARARHAGNQQQAVALSLASDVQLQTALGILKDRKVVEEKLGVR